MERKKKMAACEYVVLAPSHSSSSGGREGKYSFKLSVWVPPACVPGTRSARRALRQQGRAEPGVGRLVLSCCSSHGE